MADDCNYKIIVKGKKNACFAFYHSTNAYIDAKDIVEENGTDDDYALCFEGSCRGGLDAYCTPIRNAKPVKIPENIEEIEDFAMNYLGITPKSRSKVFEVEILCNWYIDGYEEEPGCRGFEHYLNGEKVKGRCPKELKFEFY